MTDGSFVDCGGVEDVESECQSLSMVEGGREWRKSISKQTLASRIFKNWRNVRDRAIRLGAREEFGSETFT